MVIGAGGHIGRAVVRRLRSDGQYVIGTVRHQHEAAKSELEKIGTIVTILDEGSFLFLSSAITRLSDDQWPPFLQAHYHAGVISAEDWLIRGMRMDPEVMGRGVKIHRLAPAAINTPFHQKGPQPPRLIPIPDVVEEIMDALKSDATIDKQIL